MHILLLALTPSVTPYCLLMPASLSCTLALMMAVSLLRLSPSAILLAALPLMMLMTPRRSSSTWIVWMLLATHTPNGQLRQW